MRAKIALAPLIVVAALVTAGTAHADDADHLFLRTTEGKGLTPYFASPDLQISEARQVCAGLRTGGNPDSLAFLIARNHHMNKGQVQDFIDASVDFYCPDVPYPDDAFGHAIETLGLDQFFSSPANEVSEAKRVCTSLRNDIRNANASAFVIGRDHRLNKEQAESFINTAIDFYCPDVPHPQI